MKYELWHSHSERSAVLLHENDRSSTSMKAADARVIWSVEAECYEEALQKRNAFLDDEQRSGRAFVNRESTQTTRFTMAAYADQDGNEQTLTTPGWVGMVQAFIDARIEATAVLGQMYFERPGANAPLDTAEFLARLPGLGVQHLTVVDLRSIDDQERMCQEFYGSMLEPARIRHMVAERLGSDLSKWVIVHAHVLQSRD